MELSVEMARRKAEAAPTCQYTYKVCTNIRSTKRNGSLHLLCDYHRKKANAIQRAYANKKRQQQPSRVAPVAESNETPQAMTTPPTTTRRGSARTTDDTQPPAAATPCGSELAKTKKNPKKEPEPTIAFTSVLDTLVPPSFPTEEPPPEYPMWEYLETILFET
ncbi:hypothetical protein SDRG_02853 [Saprolegnia diclina VS20]|uniref:Uncharacterized protein n=1 Tax=Saprolegnia diclina (strain VS20) TaxID=1156394 RepID=T0R1J5_SAPDV|nr:hypothetical protein SDRG_02853 [Saprolegnia diclina VS20]EQC40205.1 hypothetical protein SDRG_02853 [Saprolegnia diclina VS20]|eukprot:XP_008606679.1 hypothetical protein SDRG_02853 [Saprolegnia diclina VS20]